MVKKVGDVMYDSILYYSKLAEKKINHPQRFKSCQSWCHPFRIPHSIPHYYLVTLHRAENTDNPKRLKSILRALNEIGKDVPIILPLHPRTKKMMKVYHLFSGTQRIKLIDPVSYLDMLTLEKNAKTILTDSGGVQKEAYWFGVPCFTLRKETEWVETIHSGWNILVGTNQKEIVKTLYGFKGKHLIRIRRGKFGDGKTGEKIVQVIVKHVGVKR